MLQTYEISAIKHVTIRFQVIIVQINSKEMYKNCVLHRQSRFFCKLDLMTFFVVLVAEAVYHYMILFFASFALRLGLTYILNYVH